jgi:hypothetical protein
MKRWMMDEDGWIDEKKIARLEINFDIFHSISNRYFDRLYTLTCEPEPTEVSFISRFRYHHDSGIE